MCSKLVALCIKVHIDLSNISWGEIIVCSKLVALTIVCSKLVALIIACSKLVALTIVCSKLVALCIKLYIYSRM